MNFFFLPADAINNAAGLGFSGYDKNGHPTWAGITNVDIVKFQVGCFFVNQTINNNNNIKVLNGACIYQRGTQGA